ncbi:MAG: SDR family NAD(P)-dependent oxidoreductase [Cardiobacteriaceae bacterium]|nr:SDR family NAD(P)-dependent oxidoreductase [Cardiobacteriaceae bacterium]
MTDKISGKKSILITGCSSGIGYTAAHLLQQRGWQVFASARDAADVERLKSEGLQAVQLDLIDTDSISMALDWVLKNTGGTLDALFNNGAFAIPGALEDLSRNALTYQLDNGLLGWHELTMRVLPVMRAQGHGRIVNNSSVLGLAAMRFRGAYCTTKFALEGWSDVLRLELAGSGIFVSLIEPGPIKTAFRDNSYEQFKQWIDIDNTIHKHRYLAMIARLKSDKPLPFTLPPEAVVNKLIHAIESPKPRARYYVTALTWLMGITSRLLPTFLLDKFILWLAARESKRYRPF